MRNQNPALKASSGILDDTMQLTEDIESLTVADHLTSCQILRSDFDERTVRAEVEEEAQLRNIYTDDEAVAEGKKSLLDELEKLKNICIQDFIGVLHGSQSASVAVQTQNSAVLLASQLQHEKGLYGAGRLGALQWPAEYFESLPRMENGLIIDQQLRVHNIVRTTIREHLLSGKIELLELPCAEDQLEDIDCFGAEPEIQIALITAHFKRILIAARDGPEPSGHDTELTRMARDIIAAKGEIVCPAGTNSTIAFAVHIDLIQTQLWQKRSTRLQKDLFDNNKFRRDQLLQCHSLLNSTRDLDQNFNQAEYDRAVASVDRAIKAADTQSQYLELLAIFPADHASHSPLVSLSQIHIYDLKVSYEFGMAGYEVLCCNRVFALIVQIYNICRQEGRIPATFSWPALSTITGFYGQTQIFQDLSPAPSNRSKYTDMASSTIHYKTPLDEQTKVSPLLAMSTTVTSGDAKYTRFTTFLRATKLQEVLLNKPLEVHVHLNGTIEERRTILTVSKRGPELSREVFLALVRRQAKDEERQRAFGYRRLYGFCVFLAGSIHKLWDDNGWFCSVPEDEEVPYNAKGKVEEVLLDIVCHMKNQRQHSLDPSCAFREQLTKLAKHMMKVIEKNDKVGLEDMPVQGRESLKTLEKSYLIVLKRAANKVGLIEDIFTAEQKRGVRGFKKKFDTGHEAIELFGWFGEKHS